MKMREILFYAIPRLLGVFSASEAVAKIPNVAVKNRLIPLETFNLTIPQYDKVLFAIHGLPVVGWSLVMGVCMVLASPQCIPSAIRK
jgi:hypothetical protein